MNTSYKKINILMADDDPDDYYLFRDAIEDAGISADLRMVSDGQELLDYLFCRGKFKNNKDFSIPTMIFLDLNMPRKNGWEALAEIKASGAFRLIPIIVFTTSKDEEDIVRSYSMGASSYIIKPSTFESLVRIIEVLGRYWTRIVELPSYPPMVECPKTTLNEDDAFYHLDSPQTPYPIEKSHSGRGRRILYMS